MSTRFALAEGYISVRATVRAHLGPPAAEPARQYAHAVAAGGLQAVMVAGADAAEVAADPALWRRMARVCSRKMRERPDAAIDAAVAARYRPHHPDSAAARYVQARLEGAARLLTGIDGDVHIGPRRAVATTPEGVRLFGHVPLVVTDADGVHVVALDDGDWTPHLADGWAYLLASAPGLWWHGPGPGVGASWLVGEDAITTRPYTDAVAAEVAAATAGAWQRGAQAAAA